MMFTMRKLLLLFFLILTFTRAFRVAALELDLGAGAKIDVAPYGIENVTALATLAPWIGPREGLQAGLVLAGSTGPAKSDLEISACLRAWPVADRIALFGGPGFLAEAAGPGPARVPFLLGALRLETGILAFVACAEIHFEKDQTDTMLWLAALWRIR
jgi:hypothetical protein